jgi:hypothetical protein
MLLTMLAPAAVITLIYNNTANAVNQNPNRKITITESPTTATKTIFASETNNNTVAAAVDTTTIPSAQSVYVSQSMTLPTSVGTFVWYIVNEAHENTYTSSHKKFQIIIQTIFQQIL